MRGPVVQSLNVRQMNLRLSGTPASTSAGSSGYESAMRPRPTKSREAAADDPLGHVRQPFLQVAVGGPDERDVREVRLETGRRVDLPRHAAERILRRLVAVDRRKQRRPLHVRVVVRRAAADADRADAEPGEQPDARSAASSSAASMPSAGQHPEPEAAGDRPARARRRRPAPGRYGTVSNTESRTPIIRPGTSARMPSMISRMKRVRFSSEPP